MLGSAPPQVMPGFFVLLSYTRDHDQTFTLPADLFGYRLLADPRLKDRKSVV